MEKNYLEKTYEQLSTDEIIKYLEVNFDQSKPYQEDTIAWNELKKRVTISERKKIREKLKAEWKQKEKMLFGKIPDEMSTEQYIKKLENVIDTLQRKNNATEEIVNTLESLTTNDFATAKHFAEKLIQKLDMVEPKNA